MTQIDRSLYLHYDTNIIEIGHDVYVVTQIDGSRYLHCDTDKLVIASAL